MQLLALEGIDGSGKSRQADLLVAWWKSNFKTPVLKIEEPDSSLPTGRLLRQLLRDGTLSLAHAALFLADRVAILETKVLPFLNENPEGTVISARCFLSSLVYQQDQWPLDTLIKMHQVLPVKPDGLLILDLDPVLAAQRMSKRAGGPECYEKLETQTRNRQRYFDLAQDLRVKSLLSSSGKIFLVDASVTVEETHQKIVHVLRENK